MLYYELKSTNSNIMSLSLRISIRPIIDWIVIFKNSGSSNDHSSNFPKRAQQGPRQAIHPKLLGLTVFIQRLV